MSRVTRHEVAQAHESLAEESKTRRSAASPADLVLPVHLRLLGLALRGRGRAVLPRLDPVHLISRVQTRVHEVSQTLDPGSPLVKNTRNLLEVTNIHFFTL